MIGLLPKSLIIDEVEYSIDSDYRTALLIMHMYNDRALSDFNTKITMLRILFTTIPCGESEPVTNIPPNTDEAIRQAMWFLNVGSNNSGNNNKEHKSKVMDYKQDEQLLFSAVNAVYTKDVRSESYMHWWTFYGLCQAIDGESLISNIIGIRSKLASKKKLEAHEREFYKNNRDIVDLDAGDGSDIEDLLSDLIRDK